MKDEENGRIDAERKRRDAEFEEVVRWHQDSRNRERIERARKDSQEEHGAVTLRRKRPRGCV